MRALMMLLLACGRQGAVDEVSAISVQPDALTVQVREGEPVTEAFTATATFDDGQTGPLDMVTWSLTNLSVGTISPQGVFTTVDTNGGVTEVVADHLGIQGSATVTLVYVEDIVEDGVDPAVVDAFAQASPETSASLRILYPADGVTVPRNLEGLKFFWSLPAGGNVARVRLRSAITDISIYTTGDEWLASAQVWARAAATNSDGAVEATVEVGTWSGDTLTNVKISDPVALRVRRLDALGSVVYWESAGERIVRIPFGTTDAQGFWTPEDSDGACTGCHVLNEAAELMVVSYGGIDGRFSVIDISDSADLDIIVGPSDDRRSSFKALSPDGAYMISTNRAQAELFDSMTGQVLMTYDFDEYPLQPDWSPDGQHIVFVMARNNVVNDFDFDDGQLVEYSFDSESLTLDDPVTLVPRDDPYNFYYPAYSPDGEWLAYNRTVGSGYSSNGAELFLYDLESGQSVQLSAATAGGERNSYSRWGPLPDADVLWLAFSSLRDYPDANVPNPQIYVSAIDLELARQGEDPSSAPFWLPGQETESDNHLPYWWSQ